MTCATQGASSLLPLEKEQTYLGAAPFLSCRSSADGLPSRSVSRFGGKGDLSGELFSERFNRIGRETEQILERWDNRLVIPPTKLAQRYLSGHLDFHVHFRLSDRNEAPRHSFPRHLYSMPIEFDIASNIESHHEHGQYQFPVLVMDVHVMDEKQRMAMWIPSQMRLQPVDSCQSGGAGDALYLSTVSANLFSCKAAEIGRFIEYGELDLTREMCLHVGRGQLPCNVIEGGAQVMDHFPREHAEPWGDRNLLDDRFEFLKGLAVFIGDDWLAPLYFHSDSGSASQKVSENLMEISDVLVGPF